MSERRSGAASGGANSGKKASLPRIRGVLYVPLSCCSQAGGGGGILKFYSDDTPGLKVLFCCICNASLRDPEESSEVGPTTVLVLSLVFMAIVCPWAGRVQEAC